MAYASKLKSSRTRRNATPQTQKAAKGQKRNDAGGFSFKVDCWTRLDRFLILGAESGTFYVSSQKQIERSAKALTKCLKEDGVRTIDRIVEISLEGRAAKNDHAIFALAFASAFDDNDVRKYALSNLNAVCRTGTHLFLFVKEVQELRGWGRGLRNAVMNWYLGRSVEKAAYQVTKYRNRHDSTHRDVLRRCGGARPSELSEEQEALLRWIVVGPEFEERTLQRTEADGVTYEYTYPALDESVLPAIVVGWEKMKLAETSKEAIALIKEYNLTHEMVKTEFLGEAKVWEALLPGMPLGAMVRNLGRMTANGCLKKLSKTTKVVVAALGDEEKLQKSRLHPLAILNALMVYKSGRGVKGSLRWAAINQISAALEKAFYASFKYIEPSGANHLLAIDVSGSMTWTNIENMKLTPRDAAAVMAMVTARTEPNSEIVAFSDRMVPVDITATDDLNTVIRKLAAVRMGGTDCALPMVYANKEGLDVDHFVIYTDSETWYGGVHPHQALKTYRNKHNAEAKLSVVGMVANWFSIADPEDAGMLDVVGFDTSTPRMLADFAAGR